MSIITFYLGLATRCPDPEGVVGNSYIRKLTIMVIIVHDMKKKRTMSITPNCIRGLCLWGFFGLPPCWFWLLMSVCSLVGHLVILAVVLMILRDFDDILRVHFGWTILSFWSFLVILVIFGHFGQFWPFWPFWPYICMVLTTFKPLFRALFRAPK